MKPIFTILLFVNLFFLSASEIIIDSIHFEGNTLVSKQQLEQAIVSEQNMVFQQRIALEDAQRIADFYEQNGYYAVKVSPPATEISEIGKIKIYFQIEEVGSSVIDSIFLEGNVYLKSEDILSRLNLSNNSLQNIPFILQSVVDYYLEQGFLFAKAKALSIQQDGNKLQLKIQVDEGNYCRFEDFIFRGNKVTKESTILQITQLNRIRTVTPTILSIAQENLRQKPYISRAEIIPLNHTTALIEIEENNMTFFSGVIGYDNREAQDNRLNGYLNLDFMNLYGTDRSLFFQWQKLSTDRTSIELSYHESGVMQIPIAGDFTIFREEVDSTYIATQFQVELYRYSIFTKYGLYYAYEDIFPGRVKLIERTSFQRIGFFGQFQNLDYELNPRRGKKVSFRYYTVFNKVEDEKVNKQAVEGSVLQVFPLENNMVLAAKVSANFIQNKNITQYEYFYLGGNSSLRGFMENQFFGYRTGLINLEFRYLMGRDTRFFLFTDYGYAENALYRYGKLFGFGFGLRVATRLGLLGLDYGFGYQERLRNPLQGIVHFGIKARL